MRIIFILLLSGVAGFANGFTRVVDTVSDLGNTSTVGHEGVLIQDTGAIYYPTNTITSTNTWWRVASKTSGYSWQLYDDEGLNILWAGVKADFNTTSQTGTDNLAALQSALSYAAASKYKKIIVPAGNYLIDGQINLWDSPTDDADDTNLSNDDWQIIGENPWRTIFFINGETNNGIFIRGKNVSLENIRLDATTARKAFKGTIGAEDQGNGIYVNNGTLTTTQTRCTLNYVVVYNQPQDGLRGYAMELLHCQTSDFNFNGRNGFYISDRATVEGTWNTMINLRASDNTGIGIRIDTSLYHTLINPQAYRNAGYSQMYISGGRSHVIINPDLEMQSNQVVADNSYSDLSWDAGTSKVTTAAGDFVTDGYTTNEKLAVIGSDTNDGYYSIDAVAASEMTLGNFSLLTSSDSGTSVQLVGNSNSSGIYLSGKAHKVLNGHATSLNAGAEVRDGDSISIENLHTISSLSGYNMPVGVLVDEDSEDIEVRTPNYILQNLGTRYRDIGATATGTNRNIHISGNQRLEKIVLQPSDMESVTGSPALTAFASRQQTWYFSDAVTEYVSVAFKTPPGWYDSVKITVYYANTDGTASNDVNWTAIYEPRSDGDDLNSSGTSYILTATVSGTQYQLDKAEFANLIPLDTDKEIHTMRFGRNGVLGADNFLADVALVWVVLEHVIQ
jgi:hypothetical protein